MDTIGDYLTIIRNAIKAKKKIVEIPRSNVKEEITRILFEQGYILNYKIEEGKAVQGAIKIALKYDPSNGLPAIKKIGRISTPGLRKYSGTKNHPRIINGLGVSIISTSKGILTDKEARKANTGGEVLCYVY
ncbi:MAG: 30S ribosomal protein S8 [Bacteroidetes bacterium]|nr:30S ribosomal protein S8 [Bacteroidota bacterium]MBL6962546.1 30S ribosomal protein S8 [Bacteroidota bacterium]